MQTHMTDPFTANERDIPPGAPGRSRPGRVRRPADGVLEQLLHHLVLLRFGADHEGLGTDNGESALLVEADGMRVALLDASQTPAAP